MEVGWFGRCGGIGLCSEERSSSILLDHLLLVTIQLCGGLSNIC